jgi:uncharacterized protein (DUF486 family)
MQIPVFVRTAVLLTLSNVFMTFAWYASGMRDKLRQLEF